MSYDSLGISRQSVCKGSSRRPNHSIIGKSPSVALRNKKHSRGIQIAERKMHQSAFPLFKNHQHRRCKAFALLLYVLTSVTLLRNA